MSLVGTRPPTVDEWDKYELHHRARLATKPGLTGMWQVSGRSNITDLETLEENKKLRQLFSRYSGIASSYLNRWWEKLDEEGHNDIFDYFYTLISLIRPELQEGLSLEQDIVSKYIKKQLNRIKSTYLKEVNEKKSNIFELAGFDLVCMISCILGSMSDIHIVVRNSGKDTISITGL